MRLSRLCNKQGKKIYVRVIVKLLTMAERAFGMFLVKKRNTKSAVWQNFGLMATEDGKINEKEQDKPICRSSGKGVLAKGSNTTNLFLTSTCANITR